jgi:hypothetical protein
MLVSCHLLEGCVITVSKSQSYILSYIFKNSTLNKKCPFSKLCHNENLTDNRKIINTYNDPQRYAVHMVIKNSVLENEGMGRPRGTQTDMELVCFL